MTAYAWTLWGLSICQTCVIALMVVLRHAEGRGEEPSGGRQPS